MREVLRDSPDAQIARNVAQFRHAVDRQRPARRHDSTESDAEEQRIRIHQMLFGRDRKARRRQRHRHAAKRHQNLARNAIREPAEINARHDRSGERSDTHQGGADRRIADVQDIAEVIQDERHQQRESERQECARDKNDGEIVPVADVSVLFSFGRAALGLREQQQRTNTDRDGDADERRRRGRAGCDAKA